MNEYNEGDLVEAVKGQSSMLGPLIRDNYKCLLIAEHGWLLNELIADRWTVTVIKKAAPIVVLPREPGVYATYLDSSRSQLIHRLNDGRWTNANQNYDMTDEMVAHCLPLTRLEPVPVTAKKVLDAVDKVWPWSDNRLRDLDKIAKEFGVEL